MIFVISSHGNISMRRGKLKYVAAGAFTVYNDIEENIVLRRILEDMMAQDTQKLRELLSQYIGDVYAEALQYTNDPVSYTHLTLPTILRV